MHSAAKIFAGLLIAALSSGCASQTTAPLELESVMDLKAEKEQRLRLGEAEAKEKTRPAALPVDALRKTLEGTSFEARELALVNLPASFRPLRKRELETLRREKPKEIPPFVEAGWRHELLDVTVLAGKADMDSAAVSAMTRDEFMEKLKDVATIYDDFFGREYSSQSNLNIEESGQVIKAAVHSKFVREGDWFAQKRIFYLFRPDYRLALMISGKDANIMEADEELRPALEALVRDLNLLYPEGIVFSGEGQ